MMPSATPPPNDAPPQAGPVNIEVRRPSGLSPTTLHIVNIVLIAAILAVVFGFFGAILYRVSFDSTNFMERSPVPFGGTWVGYFMTLFPWFFVGIAIVTSAHLLKEGHREHARASGKAIAHALRKNRPAHVQESEEEHNGIRGDAWGREVREGP